MKYLGYKVRYVRNITDVGHLENDSDQGEDKVAKKARLEQLEPMEVVQYYTLRYHKNMEQLNVLPPSIEPHASGHIIEQIELVKRILESGFAYEVNGSVYFDVVKYDAEYNYGKLSGRSIEETLENTRELAGQEEKRNSVDFAIWKRLRRNISCVGRRHGVMGSRAGMLNVRRWVVNILATPSIYMEEGWILYFRIMSLR